MRLAVALIACLLATAWGGCGRDNPLVIDKPPEIVRVTVKVPVSLCPEGGADCDLVRDCYDEDAKSQTYAEAKRLANLRRASIRDDCNKRWAKVRALQPKPAAARGIPSPTR